MSRRPVVRENIFDLSCSPSIGPAADKQALELVERLRAGDEFTTDDRAFLIDFLPRRIGHLPSPKKRGRPSVQDLRFLIASYISVRHAMGTTIKGAKKDLEQYGFSQDQVRRAWRPEFRNLAPMIEAAVGPINEDRVREIVAALLETRARGKK